VEQGTNPTPAFPYRLLRHLAKIPWLLERGFREQAEEDRKAVKEVLTSL